MYRIQIKTLPQFTTHTNHLDIFTDFCTHLLPIYQLYLSSLPDLLKYIYSWDSATWRLVFTTKKSGAQLKHEFQNSLYQDIMSPNDLDTISTSDDSSISSSSNNLSMEDQLEDKAGVFPTLLSSNDYSVVFSMNPDKSIEWFMALLEHPHSFVRVLYNCFQVLKPQDSHNVRNWATWTHLDTIFQKISPSV